MKDRLTKYLAEYAERDHGLAAEVRRSYRHALAVPAYDEADTVNELFDSVPAGRDVLLVLVVNRDADASSEVRAANAITVAAARARGRGEALSNGTWVRGADYDILLLDRVVPRRAGVGLARKIAGDVVASLYAEGRLASPWLHMTDADAVLPADYFDRETAATSVAIIHPFVHTEVPDYEDPIRAYEAHLHLYVHGLQCARSPYAFHAIGSTLSVRLDAYARVRGVPKRPAAEDFYLLDKLAKVGPIEQGLGAPIALSGRPSHRVPFGTGVSVLKDLAELATTYDPRSYDVLGRWLAVMNDPSDDPQNLLLNALDGDLASRPETIVTSLAALGAFEAVARAQRQTRSIEAYRRNVHTYFDGFRAMKLIRALRTCFEDVSILHRLAAPRFDVALARAREMDLARRQARPIVGLG